MEIETSANYTGLYDETNKPIINYDYYNNVIREKIAFYIDSLNYTDIKITANHLNAILSHIYNDIFKPDKILISNKKCNIEYSKTNLNILFDIYISICRDFVIMPSLYGLSLLTGIQEDTFKQYVTPAGLEILNARREFVRNRLVDNNLGLTVLANNDTSVGLLYTRQNAIETAAIKTGLSLCDLKPITDKSM